MRPSIWHANPSRWGRRASRLPHVRIALVGAAVASLVAQPVLAARTLTPEQRSKLAEQAAIADAYRQLRAKTAALPLGDSHTVSDLAAVSAPIAIGIRRLVTQADRVGRVRRYGNGDVEVDLRLPLGAFAEGLAKLHRAAQTTGTIKAADIDALAKQAEGRTILVTGHGRSPSEDELAGPPGWPGGQDAGDLPPAGWTNVTPEGFKAAQRAARLDAFDHLARQAGELKMERSGTLAALFAAAPAIGQGLRQPFAGLRVTQDEFLPEQVCRIYVEADVTAIVARLQALYAGLATKPSIPESDIKSIARLATVRRLRSVGYGLPPASAFRKTPYAVIEVDEPAWTQESIRASGQAALPRNPSATDRAVEIASQDARIAARLQIAEQIDLLKLPGGTSVATFLDGHEALADDILTFLSAARPVGSPKVDKANRRVTLTMELPLRRLWLILRDAIPTVEVATPDGNVPRTKPAKTKTR